MKLLYYAGCGVLIMVGALVFGKVATLLLVEGYLPLEFGTVGWMAIISINVGIIGIKQIKIEEKLAKLK